MHSSNSITWKHFSSGAFTMKSAWNVFRPKKPVVSLFKLVWGPDHVPWFNFLFWLALQNRLVVKARLLKWGFVNDDICVFCRTSSETIDHLYFQCAFTNGIWQNLLGKCRIRRDVLPWRREVSWFSWRAVGNTKLYQMWRLILSAMIYWTLQARNGVIFQNQQANIAQIFHKVLASIRLKLADCEWNFVSDLWT